MKATVIRTEEAPAPLGPYSQAIRVGGFVFLAGQVALDPKTGRLVQGGIKEQTKQVLGNIEKILVAAGSSLTQVAKVTVYLKDPRDFKAMNKVYSTYFKGPLPARTTVVANLVADEMLLEVDAIAHA